MTNLLYTLFIGIPLCCVMCAVGLALICTVILAPVGLTCVALGFKMLTLSPRPTVVVK